MHCRPTRCADEKRSSPRRDRLRRRPKRFIPCKAAASEGLRLLKQTQPDEIYNLAAQSHVAVSFELPEFTADVFAVGALRILEALPMTGLNARSYQASSSEMSGSAPLPKNERTPFHTRSPYGGSKVFAYWTTVNYREASETECNTPRWRPIRWYRPDVCEPQDQPCRSICVDPTSDRPLRTLVVRQRMSE